jgi:hypothetical protein
MVWFLLEIPTLANNAPDFRWLRGELGELRSLRKFHLDERRLRSSRRHCERSEAIQGPKHWLDCFVASAPRNDEHQSALGRRRMVNSISPPGNSRQLSTLLM